jgi:HlyD family secretion protein
MARWRGSREQLLAMAAMVCLMVQGGCRKNAKATDDAAADDTAVSVQAEHPSVGPISQEIAADAILAPLAQAAIAPRISAPIRREYVQRGARVHKGQLLLTLEDRDLQGAALDSRGSLSQAQAAYATTTEATVPEEVQKAQLDVAQARANLDVANRTAEERKRLLREGAIAGRETDTAIAAAVQAQAAFDAATKHLASVQKVTERTSVETAQGQLTSARGRYQSAAAQVSYAELRSPIDGVVTERPLFPGETATAGTPVITVMETAALLAKLHLAQATAQQLRVGGSAEITIPGEDGPRPATVAFISPALDPGSTTVEVWLQLNNAGGRYRVGTPVHAVIRGYTIAQATQLPPAAILPSDDGSTTVLVVAPDGTAHKREVKVGLRTAKAVQILDGVSAADTVVTEGGYGLDDGAKVKPGGDAKDDQDAAPEQKSKPDQGATGKNGKSGDKD